MKFTDYYKVLELEKGASDDDIKKSFRRLARKYHPDANPNDPNAEERFKQISEAYDVLGDPQKKAKYDAVDSQYQAYTNSGQGQSWQDFGQSNSFKFNANDFGDSFSGTSFGDLLSQLFGGARQGQPQRQARTKQAQPQRRFQVSLTLEEAYDGVSKRFTIDNKKVDVAFKPGVSNGQRLRIPEGELEVVLTPHKHYIVDGSNLRSTEAIPYSTAILGGSVPIKTLHGTVTMTVPPLTKNGKTFRLRGQGMPEYTKPQTKGDLFVTVVFNVPSQITDDQRRTVEQLRDMGL